MKSKLPQPLRLALDRAKASFAAFESDKPTNPSSIANPVPHFKAWLRSQGKTIRQWAVENGFPPNAVYRALNGVEKGLFGQAHAILVAAGIKQQASVERLAA